ncbi:MAG: nuclear transport factor 2 family protein [Myxococcota bacterium]|nr:nuclear transport factor 2 family protein [Myxococcota bacterium]
MEKTDREIFEAFLFDLVAGRHERVAAVLDDRVLWHLPPFARQPPLEGPDAVLRFLAEAPAAFYAPGTLEIEPVEFAVANGIAACLATMRATTRYGAPYENRYVFFARLSAGRLVEVWEVLDSAVLLDQMKVRP